MMTENMKVLLEQNSRCTDELFTLMKFWGGRPEQVRLTIDWVRERFYNTFQGSIRHLDQIFEDYKTSCIIGPLSKYMLADDSKVQFMSERIIRFVADEICLALQYSVPILCTETSSWKIVEVLNRIGANVKTNTSIYTNEKHNLFKGKFDSEVLAVAAGAAFVYLWGGPKYGLTSLGTEGITDGIAKYRYPSLP